MYQHTGCRYALTVDLCEVSSPHRLIPHCHAFPCLRQLRRVVTLSHNSPVPAEYVDHDTTSSTDDSDSPHDGIPVAVLPDPLAGSRCDTISIQYAGSKTLTLETGEIGRLANGSIMLTAGDTMIYTNACASQELLDSDFTPLQVVYHERLSAAGRTACAPLSSVIDRFC
jgi:hypothetical protein